MPVITIRETQSAAETLRAFAIRRSVFVEEQGVSAVLEFDGLDDEARHLLAALDGEPAGTLRIRLLEQGQVAKIERVAVLAAHRQRRIGRALLDAALEVARSAGAIEARLHAQTVVQGFYAGLGFVAVGPEFEEDGIPHIAMRLALARTTNAGATGRALP